MLVFLCLVLVSCSKNNSKSNEPTQKKNTLASPISTNHSTNQVEKEYRAVFGKFPEATDIQVDWEVIENSYQGKNAFLSAFTITNHSTVPLTNGDWIFYFNFGRMIAKDGLPETVVISHVNGDLFKMTPTAKFPSLKSATKGENGTVQAGLTIPFISGDWAINESDAPAGGYFIYHDVEGYPSPALPVRTIGVKPFLTEKQTRRNKNDNVPVPTPKSRYETNTLLTTDAPSLSIIPTPLHVQAGKSPVLLNSGFSIHYAPGLDKEAGFLALQLSGFLGLETLMKTSPGNQGGAAVILLQTGEVNIKGNTSKEAYRLTIDGQTGIRVMGASDAGVFYGIRSLTALLPPEVFKSPQKEISLAGLVVEDAPRFPYRGLHLDTARNFQTKKTVKNLLNLMSFYKLNVLHFHLTDDEGWRLEINGLPELTEVGGFRGHVQKMKDVLYPSFGSGPDSDPDRSHGCGFYTRTDFIEILKYAHRLKIEVIPELDFPGHARAAVKAMDVRHRRLLLKGQRLEAEQYVLRDPDDKSVYRSVQFWNDNTVCVGRESVYDFLETVVDDIRVMYQRAGAPLTTIHIGGDEVPVGVWEKSPICAKLIKENKEVVDVHHLTAYFVKRFRQILKSRGLITAGWQEIALIDAEDARPIPNPKFSGGDVLPFVWNNVWGWGKEDVGQRLANAGFPVVISYVTNLYFDLAYNKDPQEPGYYWSGFVDTRKAYELTPLDILKCASVDLLGNPLPLETLSKNVESLSAEGTKNIRGIQGLLWSENTIGADVLEYQAFPKLLGLAERAWAAQPEWAQVTDRDRREQGLQIAWSGFARCLGERELPRLDFLNVAYRIPLPGAVLEKGVLKANIAFPGLTIRYTTDGSEPDETSLLYSGPVMLPEGVKSVKLKAFTKNGRAGRTSPVTVNE